MLSAKERIKKCDSPGHQEPIHPQVGKVIGKAILIDLAWFGGCASFLQTMMKHFYWLIVFQTHKKITGQGKAWLIWGDVHLVRSRHKNNGKRGAEVDWGNRVLVHC